MQNVKTGHQPKSNEQRIQCGQARRLNSQNAWITEAYEVGEVDVLAKATAKSRWLGILEEYSIGLRMSGQTAARESFAPTIITGISSSKSGSLPSNWTATRMKCATSTKVEKVSSLAARDG